MKRLIFSALVLSAVTANAQVKDGMVGINTDEPRATMHIEPGVSESKGLIIPRITAAQMKTMSNLAHFGADHHAIITYLKEQLPLADRTGKLVDVADPGYYYYDNTTGVQKWKTFGGGEQDLRMVGNNNHLTQDAGIDRNGTSLGTGRSNIGIGNITFYGFANSSDLTGNANIAVGPQTFYFLNGGSMSGHNNIGIGETSYNFYNGTGSMHGNRNIAIGTDVYYFLKANAQFTNSANDNIGIGNSSFFLQNGDLTGSNNIGIGKNLYYISGSFLGSNNIGMGLNAFRISGGRFTGNNNIGIGSWSLGTNGFSNANLSGNYNIALGEYSLHTNGGGLSGSKNIGIGYYALYTNGGGDNAGDNNIAIGESALQTNFSGYTGGNNIAIGKNALFASQARGSYNIGIGDGAGNVLVAGNANIQIGNRVIGIPVTGQLNNVVAIGNQMNGLSTSNTDSDTILLGSTGLGAPKVGMGTYKPQAKLDVAGGVRVGYDSSACTYDNRGTIYFDSGHFYGCNGSTWKQLDN